jgi:DNA-directed RNA polymerase subunit RPC12/RpoP
MEGEMSKEIDTKYTEDIVCPHCGHVHSDSWEIESNSGNDKCSRCDKEFGFERDIEVTYSTWKLNNQIKGEENE